MNYLFLNSIAQQYWLQWKQATNISVQCSISTACTSCHLVILPSTPQPTKISVFCFQHMCVSVSQSLLLPPTSWSRDEEKRLLWSMTRLQTQIQVYEAGQAKHKLALCLLLLIQLLVTFRFHRQEPQKRIFYALDHIPTSILTPHSQQ
jgi:hypothetical protein